MSGCQELKESPSFAQDVKTNIGMRKEEKLNQKRVRELFDYNPETGELVRKVSTSNRVVVGTMAGCLSHGYLLTMVDRRLYCNHRLIWLHVYGYFPENQIDHINRVRSDNRLENLREVSASCNIRNSCQRSDNTSGVQGVCWHERGRKWIAQIRTGKQSYHLGLHSSFLEAVCYRLAAEQCLNWGSCDSNSPAYQYVKEQINEYRRSSNLSQQEILGG